MKQKPNLKTMETIIENLLNQATIPQEIKYLRESDMDPASILDGSHKDKNALSASEQAGLQGLGMIMVMPQLSEHLQSCFRNSKNINNKEVIARTILQIKPWEEGARFLMETCDWSESDLCRLPGYQLLANKLTHPKSAQMAPK